VEVHVGHRLSDEVRRQVIRLAAQGRTYREIVDEAGVSEGFVRLVTAPMGGVIRPDMWRPSSARLSLEDRVNIKVWLVEQRSFSEIANRLGRSTSTISREVGGRHRRDGYAPFAAHRRACARARRPKVTKLASSTELCARVIGDLEQLWSPQQIATKLRVEFPDRPEMWVSHETIYKSIYIQGRGELRRELARCLRTGRAQRRPQGRVEKRDRFSNMVMISDRPAEAADRAVPGHWEGDLIIGKDGRSAIATLVERSTRYVMLAKIPNQKAETVRKALIERVHAMPAHLWRSLTWDQGSEMAEHELFTIETGIDVFFCDPHAPWQRGSNENTNGLLRQYFPKGTALSCHSQEHLDAVAAQLNGRPRETLNWQTPAERLAALIATTG
jgi:IS30 family transposase